MLPLSRRALAVVFLSAFAIAFVASIVEVHEPDAFHHLALGRDIVRNGLRADEPFLYPLRGVVTGPAAYWLGSLAIFGWHALTGDGGLALLPALLGAIAVCLLLLDASPRSGKHSLVTLGAAALPLALAVAAFRYRASARPETFGLAFLVLTLWAIRRLEDGRSGPVLAFPALVLVWANVHPSVVAGLAAVAIFIVAGVVQRAWVRLAKREPRETLAWREVAIAAGACVAGALACLATPSPSSPIRSAVSFAASVVFPAGGAPAAVDGGAALPWLRSLVAELRPPGSADWARPAGLLLLLTAASFAIRARALRLREVVTFAAFAFLASRSLRFMVLFSIASAPFAARNLGEALAAAPPLVRRLPARAALAAACLAAAALTIAVPLAFPAPGIAFGTGLRRGAFPVRAADHLQAIGFRGRAYNAFAAGGYLAWRGIAPFQDGRGLLPVGREEAALLGPAAGARFDALDGEWRFDALVLDRSGVAPDGPPIPTSGDWLVSTRRWSLVAFDDGGLLFLRRDGVHADAAARDEYRVARPAYAPYRWEPADLPALAAEYRRSVGDAPDCVICRYFLGATSLAAGRPEDALAAVAPALGWRGPEVANPLRVAARANEALERLAEARRMYERLLATGVDDGGARRGLAAVALREGDVAGAEKVLRPSLAVERPAAADLELGLELARRTGRPGEVARLEGLLDRERGASAAAAMRERGLAAFDAGDLASAVAWLERAAAASESASAHSELGQIYLRVGRTEDALREQRRALDLDPRHAPAHYGLGLALAARGDRTGAEAAYRRCIELEPAGVLAIQASQRLRAMGAR